MLTALGENKMKRATVTVDLPLFQFATLSAEETTLVLPGGATMEFVWIEPGTADMGSPPSDAMAASNEFPQHTVVITKGFWMAKFVITQGQWLSVVGTSPLNQVFL